MAMVLICLLIMVFSGRDFPLLPAVALLVLTMTVPALFKPVAWLWLGFSHFLGSIVSKIILSVLFFAIVTPIGLARRLSGADSLKLKDWRAGKQTSFIDRNKTYSRDDLEHPY
ncbi:MAG TPA: hypothetical protein ENO25_02115 [Desulfobacteraceae bacterium]|nr:hypothetical protein [Desulfobacteraceae bacterium]